MRRRCAAAFVLLFGVAENFSAPYYAAAAPAGKNVSKAMTADPQRVASLAVFLREYHRALSVSDRQYLVDHTTFPLPFASTEYDMEAKTRQKKLHGIDDLLKVRRLLRWPQALIPRGPEELLAFQRGRERCSEGKQAGIPNWKEGGPAVEITDNEASLTYIADPCESETHMVTLRFARADNVWRLRERAVRMGPK